MALAVNDSSTHAVPTSSLFCSSLKTQSRLHSESNYLQHILPFFMLSKQEPRVLYYVHIHFPQGVYSVLIRVHTCTHKHIHTHTHTYTHTHMHTHTHTHIHTHTYTHTHTLTHTHTRWTSFCWEAISSTRTSPLGRCYTRPWSSSDTTAWEAVLVPSSSAAIKQSTSNTPS